MTYKLQTTFHLTPKTYLYLDSVDRDDDRPSPFGLVKPHCRPCGRWVGDCDCSDKRMEAGL